MSNNEINRVPELIPQDIANSSADFVQFLKKYYEFLNQDGMPSDEVARALHRRNLDLAIDNYLDVLYLEFGYGYVFNRDANKANILSNLGQIYSGKGSLDSVKVLFRLIFGEEVNIRLPKEVILQPSHGNWLSQYSVMAVVQQGDPYEMIGKFVEVETTFADTPTQTFDVEIKRVELRDEAAGVYELYTSRYFSGFFSDSSIIKYNDTTLTLIKSCSAVLGDGISEAGAGFRVGDVYDVVAYQRGNQYNDLIGIPSSLTRRVRSNSNFRRIDEENVDIDVRTDGTLTEVITRETDRGTIKISNIIRGNDKVVRIEYPDGTVKETTESLVGKPTPNLQVDWDAIAEAMIELNDYGFAQNEKNLYDLLLDTNPSTSEAYADFNADGSISVSDAIIVLRHAVGLTIDPNVTATLAEYQTRYGEPIAATASLALFILKVAVGIDPSVSPLERFISDGLTATLGTESTRIRGDIDNDGKIDTGDFSAMVAYSDDIQRDAMDQDLRTYIDNQIMFYFNSQGYAAWDALTDQEKYDNLLLGFGVTYQEAERNALHDFLLQEDVDYPGFVRADINNDGTVDLDDVKLLLRRATGIDVASGSIKDINYASLVGGYASADIDVQVPVNSRSEGAAVSTVIENGVVTTLRIASPSIGLTSATVEIIDPARSANAPKATATVDIRDGKIRDVDMTAIEANYSDQTYAKVNYTQDTAKLFPITSSGVITGFNIVDGGTGYLNTSTLNIKSFGGSGFVGNIVTTNGRITGFEIVNGGLGYTTPEVVINSVTGSGATAEAVLDGNGTITAINITDPGSNYNFYDSEETNIASNTVTINELSGTPPTEEAQVSRIYTVDGVITDVTIVDGGQDYVRAVASVNRVTDEPDLRPIVQDGVITDVVVDSEGLGYKEDETTLVVNASRYEPDFVYELDGSGSITSFDIPTKAQRSGWSVTSDITITDPNWTGTPGVDEAQIELLIFDGYIYGIEITDPGAGYTDTVEFVISDRNEVDISIDIDVDHFTWIDEVIVEPLIGSVYNPLLAAGSGEGATVRVQEVDGSGGISRLKFQTFGYNYPDFFTTFIEPKDENGNVATVAFKSTVVGVTEPTYVDRKGFLSDIIKVQDNNFYQQFSYVIETGVNFELFEDIVRKSVHPAGMKVFGEQTITDKFELDSSIDEAYAIFKNYLLLDLTSIYDNKETYHLYKQSDSTNDQSNAVDSKEIYHLFKPKEDSVDVQSNTDDVWKFDKDLTVSGYHEYTDVFDIKETYHMFKESDSTKDQSNAVDSKETYVMHKPLQDDAITSDDTTLADDDIYALTKVLSDNNPHPVNIKETYHLFKPKEDSTSNSDDDYWHFDKDRTDTADAEDSKETYVMFKPLQDTAVTSDDTTLTDDDIYSINKVLSENYRAEDSKENLHLFKSREDSTSGATDTDYWKFDKYRNDTVDTADSEQTFETFKPKFDVADTADSEVYKITKPKSDSTTVSDSQIVAIGLNIYQIGVDPITATAENTTSNSDTDYWSFTKVLSDTAIATDDTTIEDDDIYSINKARADLADAQDEGGSIVQNIIYAIDYFDDAQDYANQNFNYTF